MNQTYNTQSDKVENVYERYTVAYDIIRGNVVDIHLTEQRKKMNEDGKQRWIEFDNECLGKFGVSVWKSFGLENNDKYVDETLSGRDARTFPRDYPKCWVDNMGTRWVRQGLDVFEFRVKRAGMTPQGNIRLIRKVGPITIQLICAVNRFNPNNLDVVGEGIAMQNGDIHTSTVCGRSVLELKSYHIENTGNASIRRAPVPPRGTGNPRRETLEGTY